MRKILLSFVALCASSAAMADITIDQIAGLYKETYSITGDDYYVYSATDAADSIKILKTGDAAVTIYGLLGDANAEVEGIVDLSAKTITIAPQTVLSYYTLCGATESDPVIATIADDGTISFEGANLSYWSYAYGTNVKAKLERYGDAETITTLFSVPAQVYCYDYDTMDVIYTAMTTLTKTDDATYPYTVADYDGNGTTIKMGANADGYVYLNKPISTYETGSYSYLYYQYWGGNNNDYICFQVDNYSEVTEDETGAENGGCIYISGWYYPDYDDYNTYQGIYYYVNWGEEYMFDTAISSVEAEKKSTPAFLLNGVRSNNAKGLQVRDGKVLFVK